TCDCVGHVLVLFFFFFFSSRRRHTRFSRDWSSDVCSSDLLLHLRLSRFPAHRPQRFYPGFSVSPVSSLVYRPAMLRLSAQYQERSEERRVGKECRSWWSACN